MVMKKSLLNKLDEIKSIVPVHLEVEKKLLPRLKFMGFVMYGLCLAAFTYALTAEEEIQSAPPKEGLVDPETNRSSGLIGDDARRGRARALPDRSAQLLLSRRDFCRRRYDLLSHRLEKKEKVVSNT